MLVIKLEPPLRLQLPGKTLNYFRETKPSERKLTQVARKRLDVVRRLFKMFDKDNSGFLTEQ